MGNTVSQRVVALSVMLMAMPVMASPLTYTPVNPSFGGNPLNGPNLLSEANAINQYTAPVKTQTPADKLAAFAASVQSAILSRVSSALIKNIVNEVDNTLVPGTVVTQDYIITVANLSGGVVQVTTTDRTTGQATTFEVCNTLECANSGG